MIWEKLYICERLGGGMWEITKQKVLQEEEQKRRQRKERLWGIEISTAYTD